MTKFEKQNNEQQNEQLQKKVQSYMKENDKLLRKFGLDMRPIINFPERSKVPLLSRIALRIVAKQGGINDIQFNEDKRK
ncbi:MAG: hypothetical protein KBG30_09900 [Bacteroidales bacterium]|nr:hypothetical protein [Bacteroidales bacterium]